MTNRVTKPDDLMPCPFCGWQPEFDDDLLDVVYPSGTYWRYETRGGKIRRTYASHRDRQPGDKQYWEVNCTENMGGCGAQVGGHSESEAVAAWNRRAV